LSLRAPEINPVNSLTASYSCLRHPFMLFCLAVIRTKFVILATDFSISFMDNFVMTSRWADCSVCGDRATRLRYSHYGAVSCFSCRAFFRRAVEKGSIYTCRKKDRLDCFINVATRKKCAACRFAKCKIMGMKHGNNQSVTQASPAPEKSVSIAGQV
jgi:hypothetical protein